MTALRCLDLLYPAPETYARAPGLIARNGRDCSPDGHLEAGDAVVMVIVGLLLDHAPQPEVAGVKVWRVRGPFLLRHELRDLTLQEILHRLRCVSWGRVLDEYHLVQAVVLLHPGDQNLLQDGDW